MSGSTAKTKGKQISTSAKIFDLTITGDEVRYFVGIPSDRELKKIQEKGLQFESGLMTYYQMLGAKTATSWVSSYLVVAKVNDTRVPIHYKKTLERKRVFDYRVKNVLFAVNTANAIEYTAKVDASSINDIRLEISITEQWVLPDQRQVQIYSLEFVSHSGTVLEYQSGGWGYIRGELIKADGSPTSLNDDED